MKKLLGLLSVFTMALTLTACQDKAPVVDPDTGEEIVEITYWAYPTYKTIDGQAGKYEENQAKAFMAKNPNVKIKVEMLDFVNGPEKTITAIQGNTAPDVLFDAPGRIIDYGASGYLANVDDIIAKHKSDFISQGTLDASSDGKNFYMVPISAAPFTMALNKTALEKEGLLDMVPTEGSRNWTTEEFIALSKEMVKRGYKGADIYAASQGGDQGTRAFISNLTGASTISDDLSKYLFDTKEGIAAYELVKEGIDEGWLTPNIGGDANNSLERFTTPGGTTTWAVILWGPGLHNARQAELDASGIEAISVSLPHPTAEPKLEYLINGYGIFDNGDEAKVKAAKDFVEFLCFDKEEATRNVLQTNNFPVIKSLGDVYGDDQEMKYYTSLGEYYGVYYNTAPGFAAMRPFWFQSLQAMLTGEMTPEESAIWFTENANKSLKQ